MSRPVQDAPCLNEAAAQPPKPCYVYMLECGGRLYTGWTNDPAARLKRHRTGKGAKFTRSFKPTGFAYLEQVATRGDALRREYAIKQLTRQEKLALCQAWKCKNT